MIVGNVTGVNQNKSCNPVYILGKYGVQEYTGTEVAEIIVQVDPKLLAEYQVKEGGVDEVYILSKNEYENLIVNRIITVDE